MIKEININIPSSTNKNIINNLYNSKNWYFGWDENYSKNVNKKDSGFILDTLTFNNDILNTYANVIFNIVEKDTFMKFKKIQRIYWNWYHPGSITEFHYDSPNDNKFSIIYNLHNNDGGTEFMNNDKVEFIQAKESTAILFSSKIKHRGIAPKENMNRFALNMVLEI